MEMVSWIVLGLGALFCLGGLAQLIKGPDRVKGLSAVLVGGLGMAGVLHFSGGATSAAAAPKDPVVETCRQDFRKCATQDQLVDNYTGMTAAHTSCKQAARKLARYGDADLPFFAFETYFPIEKSFATGQISLVETEAKYQNRYGAMQRTRVKCVYDLTKKTVLEVNVMAQ